MDRELHYQERLSAPVRWWVLATLLVVSIWVAYAVATTQLVAALVSAVVGAIAAALLIGYGNARVEVGPQGLRAGRALLPWWACGDATALTPEEFRQLRGPAADARAYLLLRPYLHRAVRVDVRDPLDPTPYWLIGSREPDRLAAVVAAARASAWRSHPE